MKIMIIAAADLETRKHFNKDWSQTTLIIYCARACDKTRSRPLPHRSWCANAFLIWYRERCASDGASVQTHSHTLKWIFTRALAQITTHFESIVEANKNSTTINTEPISNRKISKKRNRFHYRLFTDPYKKSAAVTVYGGNKRYLRCRQILPSVYFCVMAVTSSPGDISEWPAALAPLSLSSDPLFINNTSTTAHRSLGREKVADNMQEAMPVSI